MRVGVVSIPTGGVYTRNFSGGSGMTRNLMRMVRVPSLRVRMPELKSHVPGLKNPIRGMGSTRY